MAFILKSALSKSKHLTKWSLLVLNDKTTDIIIEILQIGHNKYLDTVFFFYR